MEPASYRKLGEVEVVVRKFETCEYGVKDFDHRKHLAVAAWYLGHFAFEEALSRMRSSLLRFTAHHRVKGYHETITRFWLELVVAHLGKTSAGVCLTDVVNELIRTYPDKNILFDYYTREVVMSDEARERWVTPDLKALPQVSSAVSPSR
jgi:hypothetical protein